MIKDREKHNVLSFSKWLIHNNHLWDLKPTKEILKSKYANYVKGVNKIYNESK